MHLKIYNKKDSPPSAPSWPVSERVVALLLFIDGALPAVLGMTLAMSALINRAPNQLLVILLAIVGAIALRRVTRSGGFVTTILGVLYLVASLNLAIYLLSTFQAIAFSFIVFAEFTCRGLEVIRVSDRNRLIEALARKRGILNTYGNKYLPEMLAAALTNTTERRALDAELGTLADNTRREFRLFGRTCRATTDAEAERFDAQQLKNHFYEVAKDSFLSHAKTLVLEVGGGILVGSLIAGVIA